MPYRPTRAQGARILQYSLIAAVLLGLLAAASCARIAEPARDVDTVAALETLVEETEAVVGAIGARSAAGGLPERTARYAALSEAAKALAARARARATPVQRASTDRYAVATAGFLADYRAHLDLLAAHDRDRAAHGLGPAPRIVALRAAAMTDALGDALFYERDALDRR